MWTHLFWSSALDILEGLVEIPGEYAHGNGMSQKAESYTPFKSAGTSGVGVAGRKSGINHRL